MHTLHIGEKAPGFNLVSSDKTMVNLEDFKGQNILLLFFPFAFTGACTAEMCQMRDDIAIYEKANAQIFGISVDSPFTLNKFKELNQIPFPLLSDFNKITCKAYDCLQEEWNFGLKGVSKRSAFILDKEGLLRYSEILENPGNLPNFEAINQTLNNLI
ncbi:MAG: redoxin domain-containing protein [Saprospiraceae bacterium]|nr:redoxin domain-containing protein [Saprospiraceae bacterium]MBK8483227.1 redoxin domain-containing protein [Saprospiraceae bacterium]MBK9729440.1 redoxin domain-containing protein [Saprospiraceae bacterium]